MSLKDVLKGAKKEAQEAQVFSFGHSDTKATEKNASPATAKGSAASAKPSRELAGSVRIKSSKSPKAKGGLLKASSSLLSKEEQKEARRREREREDLRMRAFDIILKNNDEFKKHERIWWVIIACGFGFGIISLVTAWYEGGTLGFNAQANTFTTITLIFAYVLIIAALIYNFVKVRPYRRAAERKVRSFSDKKLNDLFAQVRKDELKKLEAKAEKKSQKAAKKAK